MKREFTGVFIPAHIWTSKLLPAEKMLLGEVASLSMKTGWCDASREHFAEWLHCDVTNVTHYVKKLEGLGYLEVSRTPGFRSKMRVKTDAFYVGEVVNPVHGGSEPRSPEIQDKYNNKNERGRAHAKSENCSPLNTESDQRPSPQFRAAPLPSIGWNDLPKAGTPMELENELRELYRQLPNEWSALKDGTPAANWPAEKTKEVVSNFCDWAIGEGWNKRTFGKINARLRRWIKEEPMMKRTAQQPAATPTRQSLPKNIPTYGA